MYAVKIFTLYPETFPGPLAGGIYGKAMRNGLWSLKTVNIRDYADDKHKTVDDTVFGGGSGMLMKPDIVANSLDKNISKGEKIFYLSPKGKKFNQGFATTEYLAASFLDLAWHTSDKDVTDIGSFEEELFNSINKPKEIDSRYGSTYFNHIFSGGYSSSYYSYMWSEVLDSSAFEVFEKNGIYDKSSGQKLKEYVYSSGNSKDLMEQFIRFNGKEPDPKRLLEKRGLV